MSAQGSFWVLVTGGGGRDRDSLEAVRGLAAGGYKAAVALSEPGSLAAASRHCSGKITVPPVRDERFPASIRAELEAGGYLTVIPASEMAVVALQTGLRQLEDKAKLNEAAVRAGIDVPPSLEFGSVRELKDAAAELSYPCIIKPKERLYSAFRADGNSDVIDLDLVDGPVIVQPFLEGKTWAVSGVLWRGELVAAIHERWMRTYPFPAGLVCASETIVPEPQIEDRLVSLLGPYQGIFNAQFIGSQLIDVNLRVHSSHSLGLVAGVNLVATYCDLLRGKSLGTARARPGHFYRWLEGDLRHVLQGLRSRRMTPRSALGALRPRRRAAHSIESIKDPGPLIARFAYALRRLRQAQGFSNTGELK